MAGAWTNKGAYRVLSVYDRAATAPANFYVALCTNATPPTVDTNTMADLAEITAGNGYTAGGISVARNSTDFDTLTEDDTNNRGYDQIKDLVWTASGGPIPASGSGARWAVLTDANATPSAREVLRYWDLESDRSVADGQPLTLQDLETRINN